MKLSYKSCHRPIKLDFDTKSLNIQQARTQLKFNDRSDF